MGEITRILHEGGLSDPHASEELLPLVYKELRRHAAVRMAGESPGQTLQPTALVHEAWLRMSGDDGRRWENRAHFFGAASEAMRRILIEKARYKARLKRGGNLIKLDIEKMDLAAASPDEKAILIDDAIERLRSQDPEKARVVVLKFFEGLTNREVAQCLNMAERTVERHWAYAKVWLYRSIRANG
jgi:RNA polymerase sigma factor (TIGR02999 family)